MVDVVKAAQIAAYFLWKNFGQMPSWKLMLLMYFAEREFLLQHGERLTGGCMAAMRHGPVLLEIYDFIEFPSRNPGWSIWISGQANGKLSSPKIEDVDPQKPLEVFDDLSRAEVQILEAVFARYERLTHWESGDLMLMKKYAPEWDAPKGSTSPLSLRFILMSHGKNEQEANGIIRHIQEMDLVRDSLRALF